MWYQMLWPSRRGPSRRRSYKDFSCLCLSFNIVGGCCCRELNEIIDSPHHNQITIAKVYGFKWMQLNVTLQHPKMFYYFIRDKSQETYIMRDLCRQYPHNKCEVIVLKFWRRTWLSLSLQHHESDLSWHCYYRMVSKYDSMQRSKIWWKVAK